MSSPDTTSTAQIQVRFTIERDGLPPYSDALYVDIDEYESLLASGEIERRQEERWTNWRDSQVNPAPAPDPVVVSQDDALATAKQALSDALDALTAVTADPQVIDQAP